MELDFSKLENIAYRGFEGEKARAEKDKLIEQGFTVIEGATTPFDAPPAREADTPTPPLKSPVQRQLEPFTGMDKSRNYRAMYRAACNFHERHNPPTVDSLLTTLRREAKCLRKAGKSGKKRQKAERRRAKASPLFNVPIYENNA